MVHPGDLLLDDRPLVQDGRHVVRRGADQLHPARVRLVVRLGALEGRQERVVNVDHPAGQLGAHLLGDHLHVPRQHDHVGLVVVDEGADLRLLPRLGLRRDRQVVVVHSVRLGERAQVGMVRRDSDDLDRQQARAHPVEQVVEAVIEPADQHQRPRARREVEELEVHGELGGERGELRPQLVDRGLTGELHPHEEPLRDGVAELLALDDVAAPAGQQPRHGRDHSGPVRAGQGQHVISAHAQSDPQREVGTGFQGRGSHPEGEGTSEGEGTWRRR